MPFTAATVPVFRVAKMVHGGPPTRQSYLAGGTAIIAGNLVMLNASGTIDVCANPATAILGIADSAAAIGAALIVVLLTPDTTVSAQVASGSAAVTDIGSKFDVTPTTGLVLGTTGANSAAVVDGVDTTDTVVARYLVHFLPANLQAPGGSAVV
jgi:hypothetical protein